MNHPGSPRTQRGVAVITAMLVVTIATVLAVEIAWRTSLDLRRTESLLAWEQARQFGYGAEAYAGKLLEEKLQDQSQEGPVYSRSDDEQACGGFQFTLDEGGMTGGVCDLQGRFNLNNLVDSRGKRREPAARQFRLLLTAVGALDETVDIDPATVEVIADSAADWIDPDGNADYAGAEDDTYTSLTPPYRAANFWFLSVSEFRAVRGVTPEIYRAMEPYLAALPLSGGLPTKVNVNTASVPVLMSLGENVTEQNARQWVADSAEDPFEDETPFAGFLDDGMAEYIGFTTAYFELKGLVAIGSTRLGMYSLLENVGQLVTPRRRVFDVVDVVAEAPRAVDEEVDQVVDEE